MGLDMYIGKRNKADGSLSVKMNELKDKVDNLTSELNTKYENIFKNVFNEAGENPSELHSKNYAKYQILTEEARKQFDGKYSSRTEDLNALEKEFEELRGYKELGYWRKHADLNGYFESIYSAQNPGIEFNCEYLVLSKEECEEVIELAKGIIDGTKTVETAPGFFWGKSDKEHWINTVKIMEKVIEETDFKTEEVVYHCWW